MLIVSAMHLRKRDDSRFLITLRQLTVDRVDSCYTPHSQKGVLLLSDKEERPINKSSPWRYIAQLQTFCTKVS